MELYVCKYRNAPTESYYTNDHMYVGIDSSTGGYPTRMNILEAKHFKCEEDARRYASKFKNEIYPIKVDLNVYEIKLDF